MTKMTGADVDNTPILEGEPEPVGVADPGPTMSLEEAAARLAIYEQQEDAHLISSLAAAAASIHPLPGDQNRDSRSALHEAIAIVANRIRAREVARQASG